MVININSIPISKKDSYIWLALIYIVPIIISVVMILQWDNNNALIMGIVLFIVWLIAIIISVLILKEVKKNPYPFSYLVDYDTLIKYMREEENFSIENNLESGFHYYLYLNNEKVEVQSWYFSFSKIEEEAAKGSVYYWNKEEFNSLDSLIENKLGRFDNYVLIELIYSDNVMLNEYKKSHPELDIEKYIEELKRTK